MLKPGLVEHNWLKHGAALCGIASQVCSLHSISHWIALAARSIYGKHLQAFPRSTERYITGPVSNNHRTTERKG